jgi:hypothetical protein
MNRHYKSLQVIEPKARSIIFGHRGGWVFTPRDLSALGDPRSVGMALTRLARKGIIRQLARGLYDYPIDHPTFGRIPPSADAVAKALAARDASRLQPAGAYAANILGLSEQVPTRIVFLTDGPSRRVKFGQQEIVLKRTTPRNMATAGRKSGTVIQALRHIGQRNVNDKTMAILKRQLTKKDRAQLLKDLRYAPGWIADILRRLAA